MRRGTGARPLRLLPPQTILVIPAARTFDSSPSLQPEMIVLDPGAITRVVREPKEVQKQRQTEAEAANRARMEQQRHKNEEKKPMKVGGGCTGGRPGAAGPGEGDRQQERADLHACSSGSPTGRSTIPPPPPLLLLPSTPPGQKQAHAAAAQEAGEHH